MALPQISRLALAGLILTTAGCSTLFSTDEYRTGAGEADGGAQDGSADATPPDAGEDAATDGPVMPDTGRPSDCMAPDPALPCSPEGPADCGPRSRCEPSLQRCVPCDCDSDGFPHPACLERVEGNPDCDDTNAQVEGPTPVVCGDGLDNNCFVPPGVPPAEYRTFLGELGLAELGQVGEQVLEPTFGQEIGVAVTIVDRGESEPARAVIAVSDRSDRPGLWGMSLDPGLASSDLSDFASGLLDVRAVDVRTSEAGQALILVAGVDANDVDHLATAVTDGVQLPSNIHPLETSTIGEVAIARGRSFGGDPLPPHVVVRQPGGLGATLTLASYQPDLMTRTQSLDAIPSVGTPIDLDGSAGFLSLIEVERTDSQNRLLLWDGVGTSTADFSFQTPLGHARIAALDRQRYLAIQPRDSGLNIATIRCMMNRGGNGCTSIAVTPLATPDGSRIQAADVAGVGDFFAVFSREPNDNAGAEHVTFLRWLNEDGRARLPAPRPVGTALAPGQTAHDLAAASSRRARSVNGQTVTEVLLVVAVATPADGGGGMRVHVGALKGCSHL